MDRTEERVHEAAAVVLTELRQGRGVHAVAAEQLKSALSDAAREWAERDVISKSAANLLVDLAPGIESCAYSYPEAESEGIRRLADDIADLVRQCVT